MKKKLTGSLVSGLIGLFALSSCSSSVNVSDTSIMEIKDYNNNVVKIVTNSIYDKYAKSATGLSKYYDAVLETLIRYQYQNPNFSGNTGETKLSKSYTEIKAIANNYVEADKVTAKNNASTNKTTYSEEWQKILDAKKVEDEDGLREYYIYKEEKDVMETWYYTLNEDELLKEYLGLDKDYKQVEIKENINSMFPYHIRHILNKTAGSSTNFTRDVVTESEAKNLAKTVKALTTSKDGHSPNFGLVAYECSEDSSNTSYGDVGIVTPETSFVNEFKLGVYAYDAILSGKNIKDDNTNGKIYQAFGLNDKIKNSTYDDEKTVTDTINHLNNETSHEMLGLVPANVFYALGDYASKTKDDNNKEVNGGDENFFPRNILWNNYLNIHNTFLITNQKIEGYSPEQELDANCFKPIINYVDPNKLTESEKEFNILVDDQNRPIIGVRSQYGIHFIIMEKSIFKNTNDLVKDDAYKANLVDYYMTDASSAKSNEKVTYVTAINRTDTLENYKTRAKTIKDAVKGFDKTYDYRLYEKLIKDNIVVKFTDETLKENIKQYIDQKRISNIESSAKSINSAWRTYLEQIELQQNARTKNYKVAGNANITKSDDGKLPDKGKNGDFCIVTTTDNPKKTTIYLRTSNKWEAIRDLGEKQCNIYENFGSSGSGALNENDFIVISETMILYQLKKNKADGQALSKDDVTAIKALNGYTGSLIDDVCRQTFGTGGAEWQMGGKCYNGK